MNNGSIILCPVRGLSLAFAFLPGIIRFMTWFYIRRICGSILFVVCLGLAAWGFWPQKQIIQSSPLYGKRLAHLIAPVGIRCGDTGSIHLSIVENEQSTPAVGFWDASSDPGQVERSGRALIKARPEIAGLAISPPGEALEALPPQHKIHFAWTVHPEKAGSYSGVIWLHMISVLSQETGSVETGNSKSLLLSMLPVEIQVTCLPGMQGLTARWMGIAGALMGLALMVLH